MKKLFRNDFFIALLFLLAYLSTSPYIYGWDDQHLEIPILKHLIDPSLYKGDYYVEAATKYFTCWLYPILAKLITVKQIPAAYLFLFLLSRYVMFYWVYRLWLLISGSTFTAVCTTASFLLLGRTDEFLYRSFCHEEFSFMFLFAGLYFFYRERYLLAALLFGLGVNFHAIYNLFPMLYLLVFLLFCHPHRFKMVFQTGFIYVAAALPFLLWQIPISISREVAHPVPASEWIPLYLLSCPQNFLFGGTPLKEVLGSIHGWWNYGAPYLLLFGLYMFHLVFNPQLRRDKKLNVIMGFSWVLIGLVYFFDYVQPSRFVLDLNLQRVEQFMRFFLMGYTTIWACGQLLNSRPWLAMMAVVLVFACGTQDLIKLFFLSIVALVFIVDWMVRPSGNYRRMVIGGAFALVVGILAYSIGMELKNSPELPLFWKEYMYVFAGMGIVFIVILFKSEDQWLRRLLIMVLLAGRFIVCVDHFYDYWQLKKNGPGPWEMLRDWKDMQFYVRDHTPKDTLILTPYDMPMGGFRIHSERKVVACYRDCGIIGFDYAAAVEWNKRINDIKSFKIFTGTGVTDSVLIAILKYKVNYIVFMKYYEPPDGTTNILKKVYGNDVFSLFQVL